MTPPRFFVIINALLGYLFKNMFSINFLAVIIAGIAAFIIGFLIHGPISGKLWMRLANIHPTGNEKMSDMYGKMFWNVIVNFITAYAIAIVYQLVSSSPFMTGSALTNGIICSILIWAGFLVTSSSIEVIWMGRSIKLWLFEVVSSLLVTLSMGIIISLW